MPLIIITGYPTSGKTYRAGQIVSYFQSRISSSEAQQKLRIHYISDSTLSISRRVYDLSSRSASERSNNSSEKDARAKIYAEAKKLLGRENVVVLDAAAGNYIKGWRYQLYCEAKALRTPSCVVHVGTSKEGCRKVNEERNARREERIANGAEAGPESNGKEEKVLEQDEPYEWENWENLLYRFEEPNAMTRWDSPLFTVLWDDEQPPCAAIWDALIGSGDGSNKVVVRPNQATVLKPSTGEDYLYELDRVTQEVLARIAEWGKDHIGEGGGEVDVDTGEGKLEKDKERLVVELPVNSVGLPALQRLRRQFISMNRQTAVPASRIKESFVGYLNDSFQAL